MKREKCIDYRHYICIGITAIFALCGIFIFRTSFVRILESFRDIGLSVAYYFCELAGIPHGIAPRVTELSSVPFKPVFGFPSDLATFKLKWQRYWQLFILGSNIRGYLLYLVRLLYGFSKFMFILLPFVLSGVIIFKIYFSKANNKYDEDSKPLKAWKLFSKRICTPAIDWIKGLLAFIKNNKYYKRIWLILWLIYFNVIAITAEFIAFYLYFIISFNVGTVFVQIYKLFCDISVPVYYIPLFVWIVLGLWLFDRFRKKVAYLRLNHYEMRNRGFINARPIVYMVCGTMGKKKTTAITDMALSQEVMFRDKAFERLLENDLKFPFFPWIKLENELKRAMEYHAVYSLATARQFIHKKRRRFEKCPCEERIFGYDYLRYGSTYCDELKVTDIWETIETYAQLYFIYIIKSSLIISNYSVRTDSFIFDNGNFPLWDEDFFSKDARLSEAYSRHAHILDFDSLRLGKRILEENPNSDSFEFGVILITEVGKERGNAIELAEKKKKDEGANQKNDLFNSWLKMVRHSATVDNIPFVRVICDEQRPESWGADARDLCDIIHIRDSGEQRLAMPFFSLCELVYSWLFGRFSKLYYKYRFIRSDNTLPMYFLKWLTAKLFSYYAGIYNRFGYFVLRVQTESGTQDGALTDNKYYLMNKKIYSKRFSTDCFSDYFSEKALRSKIGIEDLLEYATEKASVAELKIQNSYFINDFLSGISDKNKK